MKNMADPLGVNLTLIVLRGWHQNQFDINLTSNLLLTSFSMFFQCKHFEGLYALDSLKFFCFPLIKPI